MEDSVKDLVTLLNDVLEEYSERYHIWEVKDNVIEISDAYTASNLTITVEVE